MIQVTCMLVGSLVLQGVLVATAGQAPVAVPSARPSHPSAPKPAPRPVPRPPRPALVAALPERTGRYALVIGVGACADAALPSQPGAVVDATAVADALVRFASVPESQITVLTTGGSADRLPTRERIVSALSSLKLPQNALLVVYFACHTLERNGRLVLLPSDARGGDDPAALPGEELGSLVRATGAQQAIVVVDGWRNDPTVDGQPQSLVGPPAARTLGLGGGDLRAFAVFYPASRGQGAFVRSTEGRTYFGNALVEALRGAAANERGEVTLAGLADFLRRTVTDRVRDDYERQQTPDADIVGFRSDVVLVSGVDAPTGKDGTLRVTGPGAQAFERGQGSLASGDVAAAITAFEEAIVVQPDSPVIFRRLAFALQVAQKYEEAARALQTAINLAPNDEATIEALGYLLYTNVGDAERALVVLEHALELKPDAKLQADLANVYVAAALKRYDAQNYDGTVEAYERAGALDPKLVEGLRPQLTRAYCRIGQARLDANRPAEATAAFSKAVDLDAAGVDGYLGLARAYAKAGDFAAAARTCERLRSVDPDWAARLESEINALKTR